jgi:hypothetical protein
VPQHGVGDGLEVAEGLAEPLNWMKSGSNSSMPSKRAAAMASSFSRSVPLIETVAIALRMA